MNYCLIDTDSSVYFSSLVLVSLQQKFGTTVFLGFPGASAGKESACSAEDLGLISVLGRSPGKGNGNPLQYSCWDNSTDRGAWWATVHGVTKSQR